MSEPSVDLSLCSECWLPYDAEEHEPKLIKCPSHPLATYCLQCLKVKIKIMSLAYYVLICILLYRQEKLVQLSNVKPAEMLALVGHLTSCPSTFTPFNWPNGKR